LPIWSWFWAKATKADGRLVGAGDAAGAAVPGRVGLALVDEALGERAGEVAERVAREGGVVAGGLAGRCAVQRVVEVVVPLCGQQLGPVRGVAGVEGHDVALVLGGEVDEAVGEAGADAGGGLGEQGGVGGVLDLVDGVEAQAVEAELVDPHHRVVDEEVAHGALAVVDGRAPGGLALGVEELRRVEAEVVPVRSEVVVDDVEQDHQAAGVGGVDEALEALGAAVGAVRAVGQHAVVAPAAGAGELGDGHDLDRGDAEVGEGVEAVDGGVEGAGLGEGADVELVDHRLLPGAAGPVGLPVEGGVGERARAVHVAGLGAGGGVGHGHAVGEDEGVGCAGGEAGQRGVEPAALAPGHGMVGAARAEGQAVEGGRPERKARAAVGAKVRAPAGFGLGRHRGGCSLVGHEDDDAERGQGDLGRGGAAVP
jgi:hypothetical protein